MYVGDNRLAHVVWEGDMTCPVGLPGPKRKAPVGPIDILEAQRDDVLRAETKTGKAERMARLRTLIARSSLHTASTRSTSSGVGRDGSEALPLRW